MTEVAFHFNAPDRLDHVCRLLRKASSRNARAVVVSPADLLDKLDTALWTFSALDFVAHCRAGDAPDLLQASPVVLASDLADSLPHHELLVNLAPQVPSGFERFARVVEVVSTDEADRAAARQRWKHYADRGYKIDRHDLNTSGG